jgi:hypothetical protein
MDVQLYRLMNDLEKKLLHKTLFGCHVKNIIMVLGGVWLPATLYHSIGAPQFLLTLFGLRRTLGCHNFFCLVASQHHV